jgi:transcriptional regulator with XRE-family HTH domain
MKKAPIRKDRVELVRCRKKAGVSQLTIARRAGVSLPTIVNFERNRDLRPANDRAVRAAYGTIGKCTAIGLDGKPGQIDSSWLRRQTESFLRANCLGVVEKDGKAHVVLSTERVYEYGRVLLLSVGRNVD